jgi:hypothetical protein
LLEPCYPLPCVSVALADFHMCPFSVIKQEYVVNIFSEFCESFW